MITMRNINKNDRKNVKLLRLRPLEMRGWSSKAYECCRGDCSPDMAVASNCDACVMHQIVLPKINASCLQSITGCRTCLCRNQVMSFVYLKDTRRACGKAGVSQEGGYWREILSALVTIVNQRNPT